jgi:AGZA family xanthine/uracil permease-like MFS transporter
MEFLSDLLAALAVVANGIPQGLLALSFGFAGSPTAIAFVIGALGSIGFASVATISFQAETITLAGTMGKNVKERLSIVFWGALFLLIPSLFGLNKAIIDFVGPIIVNSMMAGVGIMLTFVSIRLFYSEKLSGGASMISGLIVWFATQNLLYTIIVSVLVSTIIYNVLKSTYLVKSEDSGVVVTEEKFRFGNIIWKFWESPAVLIGAPALFCLNIGANISFGKITASMAGTEANIDHLAVYSSLADIGSSLFGGGPVESIISGTATAPHPLLASVLMMLIMAVILLLKLLPVIGRYVHKSAIAGFLFVLGAFVTFATNAYAVYVSAPEFAGPFGFGPWGMIIAATIIVSARWNPFFGLLSGLAIKLIFGL